MPSQEGEISLSYSGVVWWLPVSPHNHIQGRWKGGVQSGWLWIGSNLTGCHLDKRLVNERNDGSMVVMSELEWAGQMSPQLFWGPGGGLEKSIGNRACFLKSCGIG